MPLAAEAATAGRPRRLLAPLSVAVLLAHLWLADEVLPPRIGDGAERGPVRMDVAFVRELQPTASPVAAPVPATPAPALRSRAASPLVAASAPEALQPLQAVAAASAPDAIASAPLTALPDLAEIPALATLPTLAAAVPEAAATAASAPAFEWPPSTRLRYRLTGNYRGPVEGQASVEWLRSGSRYQVFMDLSIGPAFAPLMSRRVSSEGEITPEGLSPRRFDQDTRAVLRDRSHVVVHLDPDQIRLATGQTVPRPPGVQDSASQFVHLTWLFTTRPEWLTRGRSIELPVALPRYVQPWIYDVQGSETLATPAGPVEAVHVKPRVPARRGNDLLAEIWVAPSLQYLPVRILVRQDAETYVDMLIEQLPQQAETPTPPR